jgi:hypothetical protein
MTPIDYDMAMDDAKDDAKDDARDDRSPAAKREAKVIAVAAKHVEELNKLAEDRAGEMKPVSQVVRKRRIDENTPVGVPILVWTEGFPTPLLVERAVDGLFYDTDVVSAEPEKHSWVEAMPIKVAYGEMHKMSYVTIADINAHFPPAE